MGGLRAVVGTVLIAGAVLAPAACTECSTNEVRDGNRCIRTCNADADCAAEQICESGRCRDGTREPRGSASSSGAASATASSSSSAGGTSSSSSSASSSSASSSSTSTGGGTSSSTSSTSSSSASNASSTTTSSAAVATSSSSSGAPDAGPEELLFVDDTADEFNQGQLGNATVYVVDALTLANGSTTGIYTSRVFPVAHADARNTLAWTPAAPYGKDIPTGANVTEVGAYVEGGLDPTGLTLLLHFNRPEGTVLSDADTFSDDTGRGHVVQMVDLNPPDNSSYTAGRLQQGVHLKREDYLRLVDSDVDDDFAFGTGEFTWAIWVRITDCALSEDNAVAMGGEDPHVWIGALCPTGTAHWQVNDDTGAGVGAVGPVIVDGQWHHLVGIKRNSPNRALLYVDGAFAATVDHDWGTFSAFTKEIFLGNFPIGSGPGYNYQSELEVDEAAIFKRRLTVAEIRQLHQRGALRLGLQVRNCLDAACSTDATWLGPDGTDATRFGEPTPATVDAPAPVMLPTAITGPYVQYRVILESDAPGYAPRLLQTRLNLVAR
ncbi:MAG: LamG domain-containing protein [Myxococcota bacterium]